MSAPYFHRPADGWVGDVIPFAHADRAFLFYLHDRRDPARPGTSWNLYTTSDFASYDYEGVSLPHGGLDEQDLNAYTGSIVEDEDGAIHLFYTGQNPDFLTPDGDLPAQVVMHATSTDGMQSWTKHHDETFGAPEGYDAADFRDPFVFRPTAEEPWQMLVATRELSGPDRRRGVIARLVSDDLVTWKPETPFWAPGRYLMHECPEVFELGGHWYLVYSEFSDAFLTRYRISDNPFGPWRVPEHDTIDGRGLYAAKSLELGGRRYFAGWIPTREGESDDGAWQWAGNLAVHEVTQGPDGELGFGMPHALRASFTEQQTLEFTPYLGAWFGSPTSPEVSVPDGYALTLSPPAPESFLLSVDLVIGPETTECGVLLRAEGDEGYLIRLEPRRGRMVFDRWPRRHTGPAQWQISGDVAHQVELERPAHLAPGPHRLSVLVDGTSCIAYLDDKVAMSARIYDRSAGCVGLFVGEGTVAFTAVSVATQS
ncbi:GH32 C-terminal domain-containing protein [Nocardioides cavernaquae]|uniref:beta-fructofuranosidase n=1 Tax=Nocardioides cavernaquae TaxID=2321396 RepID=A0A3A5HD68_9ACTN|nr:GH32 C-terminal domain-containing protein [Nocardioides cavernaquae]RJS45917.1 glycoside hydrolase [Nocardioides cavernaquae]